TTANASNVHCCRFVRAHLERQYKGEVVDTLDQVVVRGLMTSMMIIWTTTCPFLLLVGRLWYVSSHHTPHHHHCNHRDRYDPNRCPDFHHLHHHLLHDFEQRD